MNVEYINPFIESLDSYFKTSLKTEATRGTLGVSKGEVDVRDFAVLIGLSGEVQGVVSLAISVKTALAIASKAQHKQVVIIDDTVNVALAEMIRSVAIDAKKHFPEGTNITLSASLVLRGAEYSQRYPGGVWLEVPFASPMGEIKLRVALKGS
jgi:CheY-specific phosphatase CheX